MDESTAQSRHPDSMGRAFLWALFPTLVLFLIAPPVGDAQEVTTNITSSGLGTVVPLQPPSDGVYNITGGTRPGDGPNLFHSFGDFSVGSGDIANFLNNTNIQTSNIIGRVTELGLAHTSYIYGTIQTTDFGNANLFLVNPSGFVFGPHGSVSVNGSVSFTTAQYLRLSDGVNSANFYANPASDGNSILVVDSVVNFGFLSLATPAAYGFLTPPDPSATITVQGSALSVLPGQSISLVGGKVVIQGYTLPDGTVQQPAHLSAPNGTIQLASTASPGEFDVTTLQPIPNVDGTSFTSFGSVSLASASSIDVSGASTVFIKGGQIVLSMNDAVLSTSQTPSSPEMISLSPGSSIVTSNSGTDPGADVQIIASNVQMDGALILSVTTGGGPGGNLTIQGRTETDSATDYSVTLSNGAAIITETDVAGHGGDILVTGSTLLDAGSVLVTVTSGTDGGGNISLNGRTLTLANGSGILSQSSGLGHGGSVTIQGLQGEDHVAESVGLSGDSFLLSQAGSGSGEGGLVTVVASSVALDGAFTTINSSTSADALGGAIVVGVQHLTLSGGATITSSTGGADPAAVGGNVTVQGLQEGSKAESLTLSGQGSGIISETLGKALPGNIAVLASALNLTDGAVIQAGTLQTVSGGDVTVDADSVGISGGSRISSQAFTTNAGQVSITANTLILDNGSIITETRSADGGRGGNVVLNVGSVSLTNGAKINSSTLNTGQAGDITMKVGTLTLTNNAEISSNSRATASGDAGTVTIGGQGGLGTSATSVALDNSSMLTTTEGTGAGGDIQIHAGQVQLADLALLTAATSGTGKAGTIEVTSDNLNITGGARIEASTSSVGNAGDITITNNDTVTVAGLSSDGSTRSGIFAKTQSSGGITGAGGGGGSGGGGSSQTSTAGDAGNIDLTTKNFFLSGGAQTDSSTTTSGSGGHVSVIADAITITGTSTSLRSDASRGNGKGGDIELVARTIGIHDKASVTAATDGSGNAGNISMKANESFTLDSAAIITSSTRGSGDGGTISIDSPKVLVDGPGTSITASTLRPFADLAVTLNIVHPNDGDLTVRLDSPDGTRVALLSRVGASGDNFTGTIFDDLATKPIPTTSTSAPFTGTFMPREPLGQLIDQTVTGTWKLNINDQVAGNAGVPQNLTGWSLRVGGHVFESSNVPRNIPDGGSVSSSLVVTVPAGTVVQGVGEATGSGGNVTIKADMLTVQNGATLSATTRGSGQGGTVSVDARGGLVTLAGPGTGLFTNSEASGGSGNINVTASSMTMDNGAKVSAATNSSGNAGSITANVGTLTLTNDAEISSSSTEVATGAAGSITIQGLASPANSVTLTDSSLRTSADSTGRGGSITVDATNLTLTNATISASVNNFDNSPGSTDGATSGIGDIKVTSSTMDMTGGTVTAATSGARNAGTITLTTTDNTGNMVNVGGGGSLTSSTTGAGNAGQVILTTPTLSLDDATITTSTSSSGNAGSITANVGTITLTNDAEISSSSTGVATGDAGSVMIQGLVSPANAVTIINSSLLTKAEGSGQGGDISVSGLTITLNNAAISATANAGNAGSVMIKDANTVQSTSGSVTTESTTGAGGSITIGAVNLINLSGTTISAKVTGGTKDGGNITFSAGQQVTMENGTVVSAQSLSTDENAGDAGTVTVNAGNQFLMNNSTITTESTKAGGGRVEINVADGFMVQLINSGIKTSVFGGSDTKGGNINIDPQFVVLQNSQILAQAVAGAGGAITITATSAFIADPLSIVDASSTLGISGTVNIQAPLQNVGGELTALTQEFSSAAALLAQQCAARAADGKFSTFVVAAREGLPGEPGGYLASPSLTTTGLLGSRLSGLDPQTQLSAVTGLFSKYDARPIQLARFGEACHRQ